MTQVYWTKDISNLGLVKIYEVLDKKFKEKVAVKISTGEPGGHNYLKPELIKDLVNKVQGTIVECATAYKGKRFDHQSHWQAIKNHGFLDIAPCDILDEEGEIVLKTTGKHLQSKNFVGNHLINYDSMLVLSHFKGHAMGGFGGALKNISIGLASRNGKAWIHSVGKTADVNEMWKYVDDQNGFLESMAEASKSIIDYFEKNNMIYINVLNNLSVDCDCDNNPASPEMADIGIFASINPVALDKCCYDVIINSSDPGKDSLIKRMHSKNAIHLVNEAERIGIDSKDYELINIDNC